MLRTVGLDDHLSGLVVPAGPARGLGQQLERPLPASEIRRVQRQIRRQDPHKRHIGKIMALHDHLGPHENVRLPFRERGEDLLVTALARGGIQIHAQDPCAREQFPHHGLDLLGPRPETGDIGRAAGGTAHGRRRLVPAIMADQTAIAVKGQRHVAVGAFHGLPAGTAGNEIGIAPPVQKEHGLTARAKFALHGFLEFPAEDGPVAAPQLLPQIDDLHARQMAAGLRPPRQAVQMVLPAFPRPRVRLKGRRRRSQHQRRAAKLRPLLGRFPGVIARGRFALVSVFMLLVDDDQPQIRKRGEQRRARADHDPHLAALRPFELIAALSRREPGIDHRHLIAKTPVETQHRLIGQRDLRDQHDDLAALGQHMADHLHVDLGLAAARHAVDQGRAAVAGVVAGNEVVGNGPLFRIQRDRGPPPPVSGGRCRRNPRPGPPPQFFCRVPHERPRPEFHHTFFQHRL